MFDVLLARLKQGYRTMPYPDGAPPELPERFAGRPVVDAAKCRADCGRCVDVCPVEAISVSTTDKSVRLDTGRCIFCRKCEGECSSGAIAFTRDYRMAASSRESLVVSDATSRASVELDETLRRLFGRSLRLRQVCAGGCGACEADTNVLGTVGWDLSRFGIQFVASPRHADGILVTGPVTENMRLALEKTYQAIATPKLVIAVGSCAIAGGPYAGHSAVHNGATSVVPVDLFIPGCPPHPLTILHGLLELLRGPRFEQGNH